MPENIKIEVRVLARGEPSLSVPTHHSRRFWRRRTLETGALALRFAVMCLRWARMADFYYAMDRDIVYPNLGIY